MSAASILAVARARALTRMVDRCTITRPGYSSAKLDPLTGLTPVVAGTPVYPEEGLDGPCAIEVLRVQNPTASSVGGDFPVSMVSTLSLPAMGPRVVVGDVVLITAAPDHPQDIGLKFRITAFNPKTQAKARLFQMQTVVA